MNTKIGMSVGILVLVAVAIIAFTSMRTGDAKPELKKMDEASAAKEMHDEPTSEEMKKDMMSEVEKQNPTGETSLEKDGAESQSAGSYEDYSPQKLSRAASGDVVLFFRASWCPSCRALSSDIEKNLKEIPEGVSILRVDYDTETELKKKYGVTYQHTLVQVSADGTMIASWSGSPTLRDLVTKIN